MTLARLMEITDIQVYKTNLEIAKYVKLPLNRDPRRTLAMIRCGNLPLHMVTGRFARPKHQLIGAFSIVQIRMKLRATSLLNAPSMPT